MCLSSGGRIQKQMPLVSSGELSSEYPNMAPELHRCNYFEACRLPAEQNVGDHLLCILHLPPGPAKDVQKFDDKLAAHLADGRCDFRRVYFPTQNPSFQGRRFSNTADFRDATFTGMLNLTDATFDQELFLGGPSFNNVDLSRATVHGPLRVQSQVNNTLRLIRTVCFDSIEIQVESRIHIQARAARFHGRITVQAPVVGTLDFREAELQRGLMLRGRYESNTESRFDGSTIRGHLDLGASDFDIHLEFREVVFDTETTLDLTDSTLRGALKLTGLRTLPRKVILDGAVIGENVDIGAVLGASRPRVVATRQNPRFGALVIFTNVDLQHCLLVGNVFDHIELSNVEWPRLRGRYVLYDEIMYRKNRTIPVSNLREAYQVLKQKYQNKGDHVRAGDFHYGEMEMKRREYAFPRRWFSWEFVYWFLSGYGVSHLRALFILGILVVGFALLYHYTSPGAFDGLSEALRYSIGVVAFQRPEMPESFGEPQKWLHLIEAILGPVQITLFVLALRLRLKR